MTSLFLFKFDFLKKFWYNINIKDKGVKIYEK